MSKKALASAGLTVDDIDLFEINEAFAAVALRYMRDMGDLARADQRQRRRHRHGPFPLGATGAMILGTLVDELGVPGPVPRFATPLRRWRHGHATIVERVRTAAARPEPSAQQGPRKGNRQ
ncbi:hypothetical protein HBB16_03065 [Pseudonocardia sp. MCCB 268]|nr:hypothetical protein [Pseudonocardia cytotoxica]